MNIQDQKQTLMSYLMNKNPQNLTDNESVV